MKALAILFLSCSPLWGQSPLLTASGIDWTRPSGSVAIPLLYGPAEWLNYQDQTNGWGITNWVDEIQGLTWTTGNATAHPTNTVNGAWFWGNLVQLTNKPGLNMGTNWTVFLSFTYTNLDPGGGFGLNGPLWGTAAGNTEFGSTFQNTPKAQPDYSKSSGSQVSFGAAAGFWLKFTDWTIVTSNNANGDGAIFSYTNGILCGSPNNAGRDTASVLLSDLGWNSSYNDGSTFLVGAIRHMIAYTNVLTPTQISNLHYWRTNFDGSAP